MGDILINLMDRIWREAQESPGSADIRLHRSWAVAADPQYLPHSFEYLADSHEDFSHSDLLSRS